MKKIFIVVLLFLYSLLLVAQPPQLFKYQGLARNADGNPVGSSTISLRISVHKSSPVGTIVYRETHQPLTNEFGSFSINIGGGVVVLGNFAQIAWGSGTYFQEVEMDINGGSSFVSMGTSQYLSIPYALASDSARNGIAPFWVKNNKIGVPGYDTASIAIIAMANTAVNGAPAIYCKNIGFGSTLYAEAANGNFIIADSSGFEVHGGTQLSGNLFVEDSLVVNGRSVLTGNVVVNGTLLASGPLQANAVQVNSISSTSGNVQVDANLSVNGSLSKASGSFKIDHPLDPTNKYLYHSFVESPDMKNIYDGTVTTDAAGNATIELPPYFESLNKDFRYQLTPIGQFAQAIISAEIRNNKFEIKSDRPHVKICWQVTGTRKDAYAEKHRLIPEVEKEESEKGRYLYPDSYEKLPVKIKEK